MGTIKAIHMSGRGVFQEEQSSFEDCAIANFVYGPNGSGKSTISNYLRSQNGLDSHLSEIEWDGTPSEIIVYNKEWREENFRDQQNFPGVFTLGSDSVEAQRKLDELNSNLQRTRERIEAAQKQLEDTQAQISDEIESFQNNVWDNVFKPNEKSLGFALTGYRGSKSKFAKKLLEEPQQEPSTTIDDLKVRIDDVFSEEPNNYDNIDINSFKALVDKLMDCEACNIWELAITGNQDVDIAALIDSLGSSDWVRQGMSYVENTDICPFCQQHTVTADLKLQLKLFFDDQYEVNLRKVTTNLNSYQIAASELLPKLESLSTDSFIANYGKQVQQQLETEITQLRSVIEENIKAMQSKIAEPSKRITISSGENLYAKIMQQVIDIDRMIDEHNSAMSNISHEKKLLIDETWAVLRKIGASTIQFHKSVLKRLTNVEKGLKNTVDKQKKFEKEFTQQIIEVRKQITSIQPTVDEINRLLSSYGFDGFSIQSSEVSENAYQIVRPDGTPAGRTLSEGEGTFVAFLYFMQLIKGSVDPDRFVKEKVVVIDDPICSLDSTVLYIVSCMVKQLIEDAKKQLGDVKQVFILTHNVYFHKEASFSKGKAYNDEKTKYWTIQKHGNQSVIKDYGRDNPIKTSYELLWEELKDPSANVIVLQNSMRRIIENYFHMLGTDKSDFIEEQFETTEERIICRSLFAWMNDGSHSIPDDLYIDSYSESPQKYMQVFKQIFEVSGNGEHYKMMMGEAR